VVDHSFAFGLLMALAETAVGIGFALGLFTRVAAAGGILLGLSLWLTVSWQADPWYTGADLLYAFACTPFLFAAATPFSVDRWLARTRDRGVNPGDFQTRRRLIAGAAAVGGLVVIGAAALFRKDPAGATGAGDLSGSGDPVSRASSGPSGGSSSSTAPSSTSAGGGSGRDGDLAVAKVPVGGGTSLTDAQSGETIWVLQLQADSFTAFNATCPHQGCSVQFRDASSGFACPCHGSTFASDGRVTNGPAARNLTSVRVTRDGDQLKLG
jgi:thiosulfate dehydrogenase [quinone] large subunit